MKIKEAKINIIHRLRSAGALIMGLGAGLCLLNGGMARGQVSDSETILSKGLTFLQTSAAAPGQASRNAAVFEADIPGLGGPSGGLGAHGSMVLPGGATVALPYDDADSVFLLDATNDTPAGLDASYPAGHYSLLLTSDFFSTTNGVDLPTDAFPTAPQFSNYAAAQQIDASHDFALEFGAFAGAADPDDSTLEIYDSTGSLVVSDTPDLGASSYTISSDTLASGQTYSVHLRFRRLTVVQETFFPSAFGFYSETVMNITTAGGNTGTTAPTLTSSFPAGGETIVSGAPFVLQFSEAMNQTVSIQWSESINGVNVPLNFNPFTYLWTDAQTLACLYGGIGGTWPAGAVFSWTLNPFPGAATNFSSMGGVALASGVYSGSFLTPGGPWQCAAQVTNSLEAPGFYLVKAANYLQSPDSAPVPDVSLGAQFLAYLQTPDNGALADPPLALVVPPTVAVGSYGGVELSLSETSAALLAGQFVFSSATSANGATGLDNAFPAGNYILEIAPQNPSSPTAVPVPTNAVTLALSGGSYPPVPQLVSSGVIPVNTITNGLTVSWLPWTGATTNSFVSFQILDGATNVVFSAPNSCSNLALAASVSSIAIPSNTLSAGVPYQIALSFMSISDSNKYLTNIPGLGYGALASVTRMSLLAYMSPPPNVAIVSPSAGAFVSSGVVAVQVEASQPHAFLTELQLFSGTNLIATQTLGTGKTTFSGAISGSIPPGPQSLYVVATDSNGQTTTAGPVAIMAQSPSFVVTVSEPVNGASYTPFATVALAGGASSPNGPITNVDLFMDGNLIGSVAGAPFNFPVSQVYPGAHQFYVHAFDSAGFGGASTLVSIVVAAPPKYDLTPFLSTNGSFSFGFSGDPATGYVLEAATNLTPPVTWVPVQSKLLSGAQGVFSDAGYAAYTTRYYRIAPLNASLSNQPAFSVWGRSDPTVTASDDYEVSEGALVAMTNAGGAVLNLTLPPGALELGQPVTLVSVTNLEDYPFAGPLVAAAEASPSEVDLFETGTLIIQPPTNIAVGSLVAFTYHVPNGELFLTPFTVTNLVTGTTTNPAIAIPINRMGGYGVAALTPADLNLAGHFLPSDPSDCLDQATALYLLSPSSGVRLGNVGSLGGLRGGAGQAGGPHGPVGGGPVAMDHTQLVQQFLDQFDVIYAQMQAAEAAGEINLCQYMTWAQWLGDLETSGLADEFSVQIAEFAQALDSIYQVAITKMIQKADSEHDWNSIIKLANIDLSGKLNKGIIAQGWQPGQEEALQQALDDCLTFEFDLDSSFANDSDIGTETSRLTAAVSFQEGNPANSHKVKGSAAVQWKTTDFPPIPPCSEPTASPSTPDVLFFGFDPKGTSTKNANCSTTYTTTGLLTIFWPGIPEENFTTTCQGYPVQLAAYWWPEFGIIYDDDLQAYPKHNGPPQASFYVDDSWQMGGGGGNPTLATRQGSAVYKLNDGTITETSTWMLKHTPQ